jgi:catechol 2,3-dioxygenase-like lactoylglutathione lyase family enzyme
MATKAIKPKINSSRDVLIQTEKLDAAVRFYKKVLGLRVTHNSKTLVGFETGSFCLYVDRGPAYGPVFEFYVADFAAAKKKLLAAGCRVENEDPSVPRCYLRDPFGLVFNLAES